MHFLIYLFHAELTSLNCEIVARALSSNATYHLVKIYSLSIVPNNYRGSSPNTISPNTEFTPTRFWFRDKKIRILYCN